MLTYFSMQGYGETVESVTKACAIARMVKAGDHPMNFIDFDTSRKNIPNITMHYCTFWNLQARCATCFFEIYKHMLNS